ncbi:DNA helicase [Tanacetum coccineum]
MHSLISEPCKPVLRGGYRSPQNNHNVGDKVVVLDFGNSEVRFDSCESFFGVTHSKGYRHSAYEFPNDSSLSGSYIHAHKSTPSTGYKVSGSYSVGDGCQDYFRQSGIVCSPGECSSGGTSGTLTCTHVSLPTEENDRDANVRRGRSQSQTDTSLCFFPFLYASNINLKVTLLCVTGSYIVIGDCEWVCEYYRAIFWYGERVKRDNNSVRPQYHRCCGGGKVVYYSVNRCRGLYVFKISGQIYLWIGLLCLEPGNPPRFLQLYIYDTQNEVSNRMRRFSEGGSSQLDPEFVSTLIRLLDKHNELVRLFRTARNRVESGDVPEFCNRFFSVVGAREYDLPTSGTLGEIVFENGPNTRTNYDVIIESRVGFPQRQNRLDYYRLRQNDIRREYLSGVHDAISRGDQEGFQVGGRLILPRTFTVGPRYMYSHYLDALAICRVLDRANIIVRVFEQKVQDFCKFLKVRQLFGFVTGLLYTIKFQKRGLPHCHTLVWVDSKDNIQNASEVDRYISAELPDPDTNPEGYIVVSEMMVHESHKSPTKSLFDVGSSRISIFIVKNLRFTRMFWQYHKDNA